MNRVKNFLLENETYEDGLKRALRCWAVQSERLEQVEAENERLRKALIEISDVESMVYGANQCQRLAHKALEENNDE